MVLLCDSLVPREMAMWVQTVHRCNITENAISHSSSEKWISYWSKADVIQTNTIVQSAYTVGWAWLWCFNAWCSWVLLSLFWTTVEAHTTEYAWPLTSDSTNTLGPVSACYFIGWFFSFFLHRKRFHGNWVSLVLHSSDCVALILVSHPVSRFLLFQLSHYSSTFSSL